MLASIDILGALELVAFLYFMCHIKLPLVAFLYFSAIGTKRAGRSENNPSVNEFCEA